MALNASPHPISSTCSVIPTTSAHNNAPSLNSYSKIVETIVCTGSSKRSTPSPPTDTPLSSKTGHSGSALVRHLFDLRKKQLQQQKMLQESIQSSSLNLESKNDYCNKENVSPQNCVEPRKFVLSDGSAPMYFSINSTIPKDGSSSPMVVSTSTPLSQLQLGSFALPTERFESDVRSCCNTDNNFVPSDIKRPYDPNIYRSPPKLKSGNALRQDCNLSRAIFGAVKSPESSADFDRPISALQKSFEDLVIEKIKAGEYQRTSHDTPAPKKFLRKGSGVIRFVSQPETSFEKDKKISSFENGNDSGEEPKVKFNYLKKGDGTRRFKTKRTKFKNKLPYATTETSRGATPENKLILTDINSQNYSTPLHQTDNSIMRRRPQFSMPEDGKSLSPIVRKYPRREFEELKAFERLEELAENSSFSSTASTVNSLLQKGLDCSETSTTLNSPLFQGRSGNNLIRQMLEPRSGLDDRNKLNSQARNIGNQELILDKPLRTVQFHEQGAHVMEYCVNEDSLSDAPTISDASEMLNASDLEALNELYQMGRFNGLPVVAEYVNKSNEKNVQSNWDENAESAASDKSREPFPAPRHTVLRFSPPRIPPDAASYPIWQAFGEKPAPSVLMLKQKKKPSDHEPVPPPPKSRSVDPSTVCNVSVQSEQTKQMQKELESHKILLVSKVHELENETASFRSESEKLSKMKETLRREKHQLNKEKIMFEQTLAEDRRKMEEYFEMEKNKLWREKCAIESNKTTSVPERSNILEIVNLKEEILLLKKELERRDSMHNFIQNKMREKIKELNNQKKDLEQKSEKLCTLEKENMFLKHQVDRFKISSRTSFQNAKKQLELSEAAKAVFHRKAVRFSNSSNPSDSSNVSSKSVGKTSIKSSNEELTNSCQNDSDRPFYESYVSKLPSEVTASDDKCPRRAQGSPALASSLDSSEVMLMDGSKLITYANGNKKQILPTGAVIQEYYNGDRRETYTDRIVYIYNETSTKQTTYHSGTEELEFLNGQKEIRRPDGSVEIIFPDLSRKRTDLNGSEVYHTTDGTTITTTTTGEKVFMFLNGQREVHGDGFKKREFPDGTVKVVLSDGTVRTTYPNGRVRVKDAAGRVLTDSKLGIDLTM